MPVLEALIAAYEQARQDPDFVAQFEHLLRTYVGRPERKRSTTPWVRRCWRNGSEKSVLWRKRARANMGLAQQQPVLCWGWSVWSTWVK
jgi:tryptophan synthase beta subunit